MELQIENNEETHAPEWQKVAAITAQKEAEAYELFSQRFDRDFPMPRQVNATLMQTIGWQFTVIIIQNAAAVILAALRTADMFFEAASASSPWLQYIEAFAAVLAIEFGAVVFAAIKAEIENRSQNEADLRASTMVSVKQLWVGIGAVVLISMVAGLGVSFKGFGLNVSLFNWILAIVMGLGASIVAYVSGDILGVMLARLGNIRDNAQREFETKIEDRNERKRSQWEGAPERQIARSELMELKDFIKSQRTPAPRQQKQPQAPRPSTSTRSREIRVKVYNELDANWAQHRDVRQLIGPSELQRVLGVAKSYASDVRKDWAAERGISLTIPAPETGE